MRKFLVFLVSLFVFAGISLANNTHVSTISPEADLEADLGTSSIRFNKGYIADPCFDALIAKTDSWDNLVAKSSAVIIAAVDITTATVVSRTYAIGESLFTQPAEAPRNIYFSLGAATASRATVLVSGLDARGNLVTESQIAYAAATSTSTNVAWSHIYGATVTLSLGYLQDASIHMTVGTGDKIGLSGDIDATTDVYAAKVRTATTWLDETTSVTANATYDTWTHSDVPDGADDFVILFRSKSE